MRLRPFVLSALFVLATACGAEPDPTSDAGGDPSHADAGSTAPDAGDPVDAGRTDPADAGDDEGPDAGEPPDAGWDEPDAGWDEPDAGWDEPDAGWEGPDAGWEKPDAGWEEPDAGSEPDDGLGPQVFWNGGFERWDGTLPDAWFGVTSNISSSNVEKVVGAAFEGVNACRLVNESSTHRRFTTAPLSARAGRYRCTYRVRGHGNIRNARYDTDYSSYTSYTRIDTDKWREMSYDFTLNADTYDTFELIFSIQSTNADRGHLVLDAVSCRRVDEPCDEVTCESWARCVNATATCEPRSGRCGDDLDCREWEACSDDHRCVPRPGRCNATTDCAVASPETPVCDRAEHLCVEGDPCAEVSCTAPRTCNPATATCLLPEGACVTTRDCTGALPACDRATQQCVDAEHPANVFPNGGFESWSTWYVPYLGEHFLPDDWYGLDIPGSSEIHPSKVRRYTAHVHGGQSAVQLEGGEIADRFTSEAFDLPTGRYTCSYRVRGRGTFRHRHYSSGGWSPWTDFLDVDSEAWIPVHFQVNGNVRDFRLIFYASRTDAALDHIQVDDVVCTRDP